MYLEKKKLDHRMQIKFESCWIVCMNYDGFNWPFVRNGIGFVDTKKIIFFTSKWIYNLIDHLIIALEMINWYNFYDKYCKMTLLEHIEDFVI